MSDALIMGRSLPPERYKRMCDLQAPFHNQIIMPGKPAVQVNQGEARGTYHNKLCYEAALRQYRALKKKVLPQQEND